MQNIGAAPPHQTKETTMISPPLQRTDLAEQLVMKGKELTKQIRQLKQFGKLIQRRVSTGPTTPKKQVVFNFVATNLTLEI